MKKGKNKGQTSKKEEKEDSEDEGSELEEEVEEIEENIDDNRFVEFLQPSTESFSPVLEKVETPQQESLEQDVASTPVTPNINEGQIDYSITSNEPNYSAGEEIKYQTNIEPPILKPAEISKNLPRQEFLDPIAGIRFNPQDNINISPEIVNTEFIEEKTRLPFERDDKKYKEFKL